MAELAQDNFDAAIAALQTLQNWRLGNGNREKWALFGVGLEVN